MRALWARLCGFPPCSKCSSRRVALHHKPLGWWWCYNCHGIFHPGDIHKAPLDVGKLDLRPPQPTLQHEPTKETCEYAHLDDVESDPCARCAKCRAWLRPREVAEPCPGKQPPLVRDQPPTASLLVGDWAKKKGPL